jgi:hypothetical protein
VVVNAPVIARTLSAVVVTSPVTAGPLAIAVVNGPVTAGPLLAAVVTGPVTARPLAAVVVTGLGAAAIVVVAGLCPAAARTVAAVVVARLRAAIPRAVAAVVVTASTGPGRWPISRIAVAVQQDRPGGDPNRDIRGEGGVPDQSDRCGCSGEDRYGPERGDQVHVFPRVLS